MPRAAATTAPSRTTGRSATSPTARIAACGGLITALKRRTPNMPRFETVNVPSPSCAAVSDAAPGALGELARLTRELGTDFVSAS